MHVRVKSDIKLLDMNGTPRQCCRLLLFFLFCSFRICLFINTPGNRRGMLPLSVITVSQPLLHLSPNSFKLPSLGPRQQDDTLFSSLGTFFLEHSFPHDSVVLFFFWFHPFSVLFSVHSKHLLLMPFNTILKRIALPVSWRGLLGSSLLCLLSFKR